MSSERQRLQKVLSQSGVCSRRRAEELMRQGRVLLNGRPASPGDQGDPLRDRILVDGELVPPPSGRTHPVAAQTQRCTQHLL